MLPAEVNAPPCSLKCLTGTPDPRGGLGPEGVVVPTKAPSSPSPPCELVSGTVILNSYPFLHNSITNYILPVSKAQQDIEQLHVAIIHIIAPRITFCQYLSTTDILSNFRQYYSHTSRDKKWSKPLLGCK